MRTKDIKIGAVVSVRIGGPKNGIKWIGTVMEIKRDVSGIRGWTRVVVTRPTWIAALDLFRDMDVRALRWEIAADAKPWVWEARDVAPELESRKAANNALLEAHRRVALYVDDPTAIEQYRDACAVRDGAMELVKAGSEGSK